MPDYKPLYSIKAVKDLLRGVYGEPVDIVTNPALIDSVMDDVLSSLNNTARTKALLLVYGLRDGYSRTYREAGESWNLIGDRVHKSTLREYRTSLPADDSLIRQAVSELGLTPESGKSNEVIIRIYDPSGKKGVTGSYVGQILHSALRALKRPARINKLDKLRLSRPQE